MNPIDIALRIATTAHAGQTDRDGYPVILHPLAVGLMGHTDEEKIAGFLHDVVEDESLTREIPLLCKRSTTTCSTTLHEARLTPIFRQSMAELWLW